ncbi:MAG: hypothetical protein B1H02_00260 [Candidatus Latescibacteria bacterium 4484_107]|nr:MAG: hypothetical protein B1H02_00260 [Candidatus Latescibacteria bacterium 4484_107]
MPSEALVQEAYGKQKSPRDRERFLVEYLPLVQLIAGRLAVGLPSSVHLEDLIHSGVIGLIEAMNHFDPSRGVKFETFATPRIRGSILDELRALDWAPRSTRAKSRFLDRVAGRLENELGRSATEEELAESMGLSLEEFWKTLNEVRSTMISSLDESAFINDEHSEVLLVDTIEANVDNPLTALEREELEDFLSDSIGELPEQERLVIGLYYYEELTLKEIGEVLGVTESRACQVHTKAILRLKGKLRIKLAQ